MHAVKLVPEVTASLWTKPSPSSSSSRGAGGGTSSTFDSLFCRRLGFVSRWVTIALAFALTLSAAALTVGGGELSSWHTWSPNGGDSGNSCVGLLSLNSTAVSCSERSQYATCCKTVAPGLLNSNLTATPCGQTLADAINSQLTLLAIAASILGFSMLTSGCIDPSSGRLKLGRFCGFRYSCFHIASPCIVGPKIFVSAVFTLLTACAGTAALFGLAQYQNALRAWFSCQQPPIVPTSSSVFLGGVTAIAVAAAAFACVAAGLHALSLVLAVAPRLRRGCDSGTAADDDTAANSDGGRCCCCCCGTSSRAKGAVGDDSADEEDAMGGRGYASPGQQLRFSRTTAAAAQSTDEHRHEHLEHLLSNPMFTAVE